MSTESVAQVLQYDAIKVLFESIGYILSQFFSSNTLIALIKSGVLGNNWQNMLNYNIRYNSFINEYDFKQRVQDFVQNNSSLPKDSVDGIHHSAMHLWHIDIKYEFETNEDIQDLIISNIQERESGNDDIYSYKDIIKTEINKFNEFILNKDNKELSVIYYILFFIQSGEFEKIYNKSDCDKLRNIQRNLFTNYDFTYNCNKPQNGDSVNIKLEYKNIKLFWIQLFVAINIKYKKDVHFNDNINNKQEHILKFKSKDGWSADIWTLKEFIDFDITNNKTWYKLLSSYHSIFEHGIDSIIYKILENIMLSESKFVDFSKYYLCGTYQLSCSGQPFCMFWGQKCFALKLKKPKKDESKISFCCWHLQYDDVQ